MKRDSKELFFSFKKIFNKLKVEAFNGNEFKIEKTENQPPLTPLNKKLFESLRKKHNV
jgi:hypothetical protein